MPVDLGLPLIYVLGVETAFTPCFFPIIPVFLTYISRSGREKALLASILFAAGITLSFVIYGFAAAYSAGFIQAVLSLSLELITVELGIVFIGLGLALLTPFKEALAVLSVPTPKIRRITLANAFTLGFLFSIIAAPCAATYLFAIISTTLLKALGSMWYAVLQLTVYGAGISTPFVAIGLLAQKLGAGSLRGVTRSFLVRHNEEIAGIVTAALGVVTMASIEDFPLYLGQASQALRPLLALLFASTGAYYALQALRASRYVGDWKPVLLAAGLAATASELAVEALAPILPPLAPAWWLPASTRALLAAGALAMGLGGLGGAAAAAVIPAVKAWAPAVLDAAAGAFWALPYVRRRSRRHLWATLYFAGLALYDMADPGLAGWAQALATVAAMIGALNLYPAAAEVRGVVSGLRLLVEEEPLY